MNLTYRWLKRQNACKEAIKWGHLNFGGKGKVRDKKVLEKLIQGDYLPWANWLIVRVMNYRQRVSYAIFAAEQVLHIYEKKCPNDQRPRKAIEVARKCLKNNSIENRKAAYAATFCHGAVHYAAFAAFYTDADSSIWAADCAVDAAYDFVPFGKKEMNLKIIKYGIKLLTKGRRNGDG